MDSKAQTCRPHQQAKIRMERYWGQDKGISSSGAIWYLLPAKTAEKGTPGECPRSVCSLLHWIQDHRVIIISWGQGMTVRIREKKVSVS